MANSDRPNGAIPVGTISGSPWQSAVRAYTLDGSHAAIGVGDLVQMTSDGYLDVYAAGEVTFIGVCVGILPAVAGTVGGIMGDSMLSNTEPTLSGAGARTSAANATDTILVCIAPDAIYEMQEDNDTDNLELADVGQNIEISDAGPDSTTGNSTMELDSNSHAATNTLPFLLMGMAQRPGNELGDTASAAGRDEHCRWLVTLANHAFKVAQVGV